METHDEIRLIIIPGIGNSGPEHWQSQWEEKQRARGAVRVVQDDWESSVKNQWVRALDERIFSIRERVALVGHSLGCLTIVHWTRDTLDRALREKVKGALLVAPTDPETYPEHIRGFSPTPMEQLPFPSTLVASTNDPWIPIERAEEFARAWGSRFVNAGACGHINAASNLGDWPAGQAMLTELIKA